MKLLGLKYFISFFLLLILYQVDAQITFKVISLPISTPDGSSIYVAGNFNDWNPGDENFRLNKDNAGIYSITFDDDPGTLNFKFTRGSWETVEGSIFNSYIPDRTLQYNGSSLEVEFKIDGWEDASGSSSTASPQVSILSDSFYMPQLNRYRKIWLYLPKDYFTSSKSYLVLYMHDGQNLFDASTSFVGEWEVDEALDSLYDAGHITAIVVGIDNSPERLDEYSPWGNPQYGGGQGDLYLDFIVSTLKPYMDENYRTLISSDDTGMMGSSMGGLISFYAGIKYPDVFGKIGAMSSSYWFASSSYDYVTDNGVSQDSYFYMIAGSKEGGTQVSDMNRMYDTMVEAGVQEEHVFKEFHRNGQHSEWYWRREFPKAFVWLFEKKTTSVNDIELSNNIKVSQLGYDLIFHDLPDNIQGDLMIYDLSGKLVAETLVKNYVEIGRYNIKSGIYVLKIGDKETVKMWLTGN